MSSRRYFSGQQVRFMDRTWRIASVTFRRDREEILDVVDVERPEVELQLSSDLVEFLDPEGLA